MFPELCICVHTMLYTYTRRHHYAQFACNIVLIIVIGLVLKKIMKYFGGLLPEYVVYRPRGAYGCNGDCNVSNDGDIGMPSIHSMVAGYCSAFYNTHIFAIIALSRLGKSENPLFYHSKSGCHTFPQIIIGYVLGYILKNSLVY